LGIIFFIILFHIFADENLDKLNNVYFSWQLFNYTSSNQEINFMNVNPMFFHNNSYFNNNYVLMDFLDRSKKINSEKRQSNNENIQDVENRYSLLLFFAGLFAPDLEYRNRQYPYGRYNYILERQREQRVFQ
jgi:hypothetical protein